MINKILINGKQQNRVSAYDRALHYGDGIFETIAYKNNCLIYWREHLQRLNNACNILKLDMIDENTWLKDIKKIIKDNDQDQVIKLVYSRGEGQRGYKIPDPVSPLRMVMSSPLPRYADEIYRHGVELTICQTPASSNARLAGIKHLNKLENVLARNEWVYERLFRVLTLY